MLKDLHGELGREPCQLGGNLARVQQGIAAPVSDAGQIGGLGIFGLHGCGVEKIGVLVGRLPAETLHLVLLDGEVDGAGAFEIAVEAELGQPVDLLRPTTAAVVFTMGEAGLAEAAITTGCRPADRTRLEQHDAGRILLLASTALQKPR